MTLDDYFLSPNSLTPSQLSARMIDLGYTGPSAAQIRQWRYRYSGRRPDYKNAVGIERATGGAVPRQSFYPNDWQLVWPTQ